jgi:predicted acyltransferase (DUF342 family)
MTFGILCVMFLFFILLPFLPGIKEVVKPLDASPLSINMNYSKDPRYFGTSFKEILKKALGTEDLSDRTQLITLSKNETVEIVSNKTIPPASAVDHVLYVTGNLISPEDVTFHKEIYVLGKVSIGAKNMLRALAAEGKISLAHKTTVIRWVDSEGSIVVEDTCDLGWSVSSGHKLTIGPTCRFRRLYGMPIITWGREAKYESPYTEQAYEEIGDAAIISDKEWTVFPPLTKIDKAVISRQNLRIKQKCLLSEDVKTNHKLVLEEGVRIKGNVFAESGITIGPSARILGNVFSQGDIHIGKGTKIGNDGLTKSVVARGEVILNQDVVIYGYVVSGKKGMVR